MNEIFAFLFHSYKDITGFAQNVFNLRNGGVVGNGFINDFDQVSANGASNDVLGLLKRTKKYYF